MTTETTEDNVFCIDCKYSTGGNFVKTWWMRITKDSTLLCSKDSHSKSETNLITGKVVKTTATLRRCEFCRENEFRCGESGRNWVPYSKHKMFLYLKRTGDNSDK